MHMSPDEFRRLAGDAADFVASYWERIDTMRVLSGARPGEVGAALPDSPPERGFIEEAEPARAWASVFSDLERIVLPGLTHWQHPGFFAFFPANISAPAVIGELLSAGLGVQGMLWATSPACTELEVRVLEWLAEMVGLPRSFTSRDGGAGGGVIQGTASEGTLAALCAARYRAKRAWRAVRAAHDGADDDHAEPDLVMYTSEQAHSSVVKAAMIAGLADGPVDRRHVRLIAVDAAGAMDAAALEKAIAEDVDAGRCPFFVVGTVGTTGTTAIDPVAGIAAAVRRACGGREDLAPWIHIDAAHAGAALICPEYRWWIDGVEAVDSFSFNPHKWLLTNFDCSCFWTRDRASLIGSMSITPEYLRNAASESGAVVDYRDWHVPLGRRFRSLKLWLVIRHYGVEGLRRYIREHMRIAELFEGWVRADGRFEVTHPRTMNLICFRLRGPKGADGAAVDALNRRLLDAINASGRVYLIHTTARLGGELEAGGPPRVVLRMAIGGAWQGETDVARAWGVIRDCVGDSVGDSVGGRAAGPA